MSMKGALLILILAISGALCGGCNGLFAQKGTAENPVIPKPPPGPPSIYPGTAPASPEDLWNWYYGKKSS
jgi:hypothetical protein